MAGVVLDDGRAFLRKANKSEGRDAELAVPVRIGKYRGMIGLSAPTDQALRKLAEFVNLEYETARPNGG